jgi:hypothetical protein
MTTPDETSQPASPPGGDPFRAVGFETAECRAFAAYWSSLPRAAAGAPRRRDFDPCALPSLLPHMLIHDLTEPGESRLRLVGTRIVDRFGFDPTGRSYLSLVPEVRRAGALAALRAMADTPCAMRVVVEWGYLNGFRQEGESFGLPFCAGPSGMHLIFVDVPIDRLSYHSSQRGAISALGVRDREYIDIGAGLPA